MGFVKQVGEFLEKIGIDSSRIIYDYGVTKGSVRIPIAILSPDLTTAEAGIWCERKRRIDEYLDYEMRYYNILKSRGWNLIRVFAHDWVDNGDAEKRNLTEIIYKYITK